MIPANPVFGIDLEPVPADQAKIPLTDLIIRRGYGAFDFLRVIDGTPLFIEDHLARFERSAELLDLSPRPTVEAMREHVAEIIERNGAGSFGLQMFLTGGDPADNFTPATPRTLVLVDNLAPYPDQQYEEGVRLASFEFARDLPEAKTTNYFTAVRHAGFMREHGVSDVLYVDGEEVLETTRCNLFLVTPSGELRTAAAGVLPGVTRKRVLDVAEGRIPTELGPVRRSELREASEVFITSTTKGIMPVVKIDDDVVGEGVPGPITRDLIVWFDAHRRSWLERNEGVWRTP